MTAEIPYTNPQITGYAPVTDTKIFYELRGMGHPLVLIHAGIADSRMWDPQMDALAGRYELLRYDVRGFGRTVSPAGHFQDHEDLRALLDCCDIQQATLLGVSNGGKIAINFALTYPERVAALIVVGASIEGDPPTEAIQQGWAAIEAAEEAGDFAQAIELILQMWVDGPHRTPDQVEPSVREKVRRMLQTLYDIPEEADAGQPVPLDPPAVTRLGQIQAPTLVMVGALDWPEKVATAARLQREIANAQLTIIPQAAHVPNMERPALFNQTIQAYLQMK